MILQRRLARLVLAAAGAIGCAAAAPASATTILFVGNSFTYGDMKGAPGPSVMTFRPGSVTDLNGTNIGGVPALFKAFTEESGLHYDVSLETVGGKGLDYHYNNEYNKIVKPFDQVVLQSYSTLDANKPGNADTLTKYAGLLAQALHDQNPKVNIMLDSTWSRADLTYKTSSPWTGKSIYQMALDVRAGYDKADQASDLINGVIPAGEAWNRAIADGVADANPYDGIDAGKVDLWAPEGYHASVYGYYLEGLTEFGSITGLDPRSLGGADAVAGELGISAATAAALQNIAAAQLAAIPAAGTVPEPEMALTFASMGGLMWLARRRVSPRPRRTLRGRCR
jgi:hypothetical protein